MWVIYLPKYAVCTLYKCTQKFYPNIDSNNHNHLSAVINGQACLLASLSTAVLLLTITCFGFLKTTNITKQQQTRYLPKYLPHCYYVPIIYSVDIYQSNPLSPTPMLKIEINKSCFLSFFDLTYVVQQYTIYIIEYDSNL